MTSYINTRIYRRARKKDRVMQHKPEDKLQNKLSPQRE